MGARSEPPFWQGLVADWPGVLSGGTNSVHNSDMNRTVRVALSLAAVTGLGACMSLDVPTVEIPPNSVQFVFDPAALYYDFYDSTGTNRLHLTFLADRPFAGSNCLALSPNGSDTVGSFVFATVGQNVGSLVREDHGAIDTAAFFLLSGQEGTKGNYVIHSNGKLKLTWTDWKEGSPSRYFVDTANVRIIGDTIASDVINADHADSAKATWRVRWVRGTCA